MKFNYDEKRCGYWIEIAGVQVFGHLSEDGHGNMFLEFQDLPIFDSNNKDWISIPLPKVTLSNDILESLFERELMRMFP